MLFSNISYTIKLTILFTDDLLFVFFFIIWHKNAVKGHVIRSLSFNMVFYHVLILTCNDRILKNSLITGLFYK